MQQETLGFPIFGWVKEVCTSGKQSHHYQAASVSLMHCGSGRAQCFVTMETKWIWDAQGKTSSIQITLKDGKGKKSTNLAQCREVLHNHSDLNDTKPLPKREAGATKRGSACSLPSTAWFLPPQPLALSFCLSFHRVIPFKSQWKRTSILGSPP